MSKKRKSQLSVEIICPCGGGIYNQCCGIYHHGQFPETAEILMRSRYTAFVLEKADYLLATWHPSTHPAHLDLNETPRPKWLGLNIKQHTILDNEHAEVEFIARYSLSGRAFKLHEISQFKYENGRWYYVDGKFIDD
jgi:SEC-C motif domain protein